MSYRECQRIDNKTGANMRTVYVINSVSGRLAIANRYPIPLSGSFHVRSHGAINVQATI